MSNLVRSTGIVSGLTILSRLLGFLRDHVIARVFGASLLTDIFFVAFRIPNLLRSLVAEGALTAAFVPIFSDDNQHSDEQAQTSFQSAASSLLLATTTLTIIAILFAPILIKTIGAGFSDQADKLQLGVDLCRIMLPYIICISFVALCNGALNVRGIYGSAPLSQIVMNLCMITGAVAALYVPSQQGVYLLALSVLVGGLVQFFLQIPFLRKVGLLFRLVSSPFSSSVKKMLVLMLPAVLGAAVYQVSIFLMTMLASLLPDGSVTYLQFADRLSHLPIGIFSIALASVLLPLLAKAASAEDWNTYGKNLNLALGATSLFMIPVSFGMYFYSAELIRFVFQSGAFDAFAGRQTQLALQAICLGLWVTSCNSMLMRAFIARKDPLTPSLVGCFSLVLSLCLALIFMGPPTKTSGTIAQSILYFQVVLGDFVALTDMAHVGLVVASVLSAFATFSILAFLLLRQDIGFNLLGFVSDSIRSVIAAVVMLLILQRIGLLWSMDLLNIGWGLLTGAIVYLVIAWILGHQALKLLFKSQSLG